MIKELIKYNQEKIKKLEYLNYNLDVSPPGISTALFTISKLIEIIKDDAEQLQKQLNLMK